MDDILPRWLERVRPALTARGMVLTPVAGVRDGNCSVNVDSAEFVGTISYWPEDQFEFQFNDCKSGQVVVLESKTLRTIDELDAYFDDLLATRLSNH